MTAREQQIAAGGLRRVRASRRPCRESRVMLVDVSDGRDGGLRREALLEELPSPVRRGQWFITGRDDVPLPEARDVARRRAVRPLL